MVSTTHWLGFAAVAFAMVISPGPNMIYMVSRSICQGRRAGLISLLGVLAGFALYAILAALGVTALLAAVPFAYDTLRLIGATYLAWLAWSAFSSDASLFQPRQLPIDSTAKLFSMGLLTNLLNPKIAVLYLSLFPQFIDPSQGHVFAQSMILGGTQIAISACVNAIVVLMAGSIATFLTSRPSWSRAQRWIMGTVLGFLALRMAVESRK